MNLEKTEWMDGWMDPWIHIRKGQCCTYAIMNVCTFINCLDCMNE